MATPLFVKDASVKLKLTAGGTDVEYNCDVHSAIIETSPGDDVTYQTLCPDGTYTQKGSSTYVLHLTGVQDWDAAGLSRFLWDNAGELAEAIVQAHGAAQAIDTAHPGFSAQVVLLEGDYGGEADTWAEFDVSLTCTSRPTLLTTPPVALEAEPAAA